jgi:endogenous inhibitor of DNA gyrase (YacG/DUF329 family)
MEKCPWCGMPTDDGDYCSKRCHDADYIANHIHDYEYDRENQYAEYQE